MCYLSKLEHIARYNTKNKNMFAHAHTLPLTQSIG